MHFTIVLSDTFVEPVADVLSIVVPLWHAVRKRQARKIGKRRFIGIALKFAAKAVLSAHLGSYIREHAYNLSQIIRVRKIAKTGIFLVEGCDSLHVSIGKREIEYI